MVYNEIQFKYNCIVLFNFFLVDRYLKIDKYFTYGLVSIYVISSEST